MKGLGLRSLRSRGAVFAWLLLAMTLAPGCAGVGENLRGPAGGPNGGAAGPAWRFDGAGSESTLGRVWSQAETGLASLPGVLWDDTKAVASRPANLAALLAMAGGSIAIRQTGVDDRASRHMTTHRVLHGRGDEAVQLLGTPGTHFTAASLWYLTSAARDDGASLEKAGTMISALCITGLTTVGLKLAVWDECPNGKYFGWPSGHTASSFTVASVLDEQYGPKVGIPAYLAASFVGFRMLDAGDHWLSDVLFGAVLGWVVGHSVAQHHAELTVGGMTMTPFVDPETGSVGLSLFRTF